MGRSRYSRASVRAAATGSGDLPVTRRLILIRHADSESSAASGSDHERAISQVGKVQAAELAQLLLERGWQPDVVLASNSRRSRQTLEEMGLSHNINTHLYGSLYTVAALDGQTRQHIEVEQCMRHCWIMLPIRMGVNVHARCVLSTGLDFFHAGVHARGGG